MTVQNTDAIEAPTAPVEVPPSAAGGQAAQRSPQLGRGRYLVCGDQAFALTDEVTHVGRGMTADVRLDDHTVSARHAIVLRRDGRLWILDDRSTNGTIVNDRRVNEAELSDGDVIVLGRVVLTYRDMR